jgi:C-terminal processing protease CtpA/Prc
MKNNTSYPIQLSLVLALALAACGAPPIPTPTPAPLPTSVVANTAVPPQLSTSTSAPATSIPSTPPSTPANVPVGAGPADVVGSFDYTNNIITTYYVEHAVALFDMYGFVTRNHDWLLPVKSQVLGFLDLDQAKKHGQYSLQLPVQPSGENSDVNHDGKTDENVQVFSVAYSPNLTGGPFSEGDDASRGWPNYLASVKTDPANNDEVVGGKLIVWAAGAGKQFPTGFGPDGLLFTADDPLGALPVGYTIVNLDTNPFSFSQDAQPQLALYEPQDVAIKDYSKLSYTDAFEQMFKKVSTEWAFNNEPNKTIDWQAIHADIAPRVAAAQQAKAALAFYRAIQAFSFEIPDGHTGVSGGDPNNQDFIAHTGSGYGFAIRELDDGSAIAVFVTPGGPAAQAGLKIGAQVTQFAGKPIGEAISAVVPYAGPFSLEQSRRYQQARYLLRAPVGTQASVTFVNPGGKPQTASLRVDTERASFDQTSIYRGYDPNALPVESKILPSGIGYIKVDSNDDDLQLILRLFQRALTTFMNNQVPGVIIDLRQNPGGAPLGLAGFLTDQTITLGQLEYYSSKTGKFEPQGTPNRFYPNKEQYHFDKLAVIVGPACASACELEAYGFSKLPGAIIVGMYPTAGVEAEVARGQYQLPEGISFQSPTGRFVNPDGSLFLEGTGVQPTVRVPINAQTVLASDDVDLRYAEDAVLGASQGALALPGGPVLLSAAASATVLNGGAKRLEDLAAEHYPSDQLSQAGRTYVYTISLSQDERLIWVGTWCADTQAHLTENLKSIEFAFSANGRPVDLAQFANFQGAVGQQFCQYYYTAAYQWPSGATRLVSKVTFKAPVNDGTATYPAGTRTYQYDVTKP